MKIESIETFSTKQLCIVRVRTEDGLVGYGQTAPFNADITAAVLHRQVASRALGSDAGDIGALIERCIVSEYKFSGSYVCRAAAGLDTALWDLRGKREGKSVCELLGGKPGLVNVYGSSMRRDISPSEEAQRLKGLKDKYGYRAFKLHIAKPCGNNEDIYPGRTEEVIPLVRKAIGDDCELYVDPNGNYTPERAIELGKHLFTDYNVAFFEEPCPFWEIEQTAEVAKALEMPVAGGEQDCSIAQWRRIIDIGAVAIAQPDICYIGGLSRLLDVASMTAKAGIKCTPHTANRSMITIFGLHVLGVIPNATEFLEYSIEHTPWTEELLDQSFEVKDGRVAVPSGPGWGVTINSDWLDKADYRKSEVES
jgi:L-alanine-DL-glutamate epimerase-like enolase superfamily enzyme